MKKWWFGDGLLLFLLIPIIWWQFQPQQELNTLVLGKTVPDETYREYKGVMWVMNHEKFVDDTGEPYNLSKNYTEYQPETGEMTFLPANTLNYQETSGLLLTGSL